MVNKTQLCGNPQRVTADAVVKASPGTLWAIMLEGGTDASSMDFHNDIDSAGGTALIGITAPFTDTDASAASTVFVDFTSVGGVKFDVGCYVDWTGTAAVGYVWFS